MKFFQPKKKKKITLFFSLSVRPCSHRPCNSGRKEILATYFFAEELFVSLISVINFKVDRRGPSGMRLCLLQIEHKTVIQSCYKSGKILFNAPEKRYRQMTADE